MLDLSDQCQVTPPAWSEIEYRARVPGAVDEFLNKQGPMPVAPESRRGYHRMYMRTSAVLRYQGEFYAIYMCDLSRTGAGLLSPVQLLPCKLVEVWFADDRMLRVTTKNCLRIDENCYRCGVLFAGE